MLMAYAAPLCLMAATGPVRAQSHPPSHATADVVVTAVKRERPVDAPPPLEVYARFPKFEQMALSPDGAQLAFVANYDGLRMLVAYRFADKVKRAVKLEPGDISAITWADADHVLVTVNTPRPRGTCAPGEDAFVKGPAQSLAAGASIAFSVQPSLTASPYAHQDTAGAQFDAEADAATAQDSLHFPPCVYFGVGSEASVTSINLNKRTAEALGDRLGEPRSMPLLAPEPVVYQGGDAELVGPFLELREQAQNNRPAKRVYLWKVSAETGVGRSIDDGGGDLDREASYVDDWLVNRDGALIARSVYDFQSERFAIEFRAGRGWKRVLTRAIKGSEHTFAPSMVGLGRTDGSIIILDAATNDPASSVIPRFHYYQLNKDGAVTGPLEPDDIADDRPVFDPATGRLAGFVQNGDGQTYVLSDPALQALFERAQDVVPGEQARVATTARDPRKMVIHAVGPDDPGSYFYVDFATGATAPVGEDHADLPTAWIAAQREISYRAGDGLEIHALLTLPPKPDPANLPLIVLPHDGPQGHDSLGYDWMAQALASRGYLVLQPNYRGSDGFGAAFAAAGQGQWGRKIQSDLSDGVRHLVGEGLADPKRVCILGVGFGGYAALEGATDGSGVYRCAASINGVSDPAAYLSWLRGKALGPRHDEVTALTPDPSAPRIMIANPRSPWILAHYIGPDGAPAPVKAASSDRVPVLLVAAAADPTVPASQSAAMNDALKAQGKPVDLIEIKGGDHGLTTQAGRLATLTALIDFLAKNNPA
jgi:dipeptidyl aminopeptidase/acylaminoacyl peptidase